MSTVEILYVDNSMVVELAGLENGMTGVAINNATVTVTLATTAGVNVTGETWPATMNYAESSNGVYRATLPHDIAIVDGQRYVATISAVSGSLHAEWTVQCVARTRK